MNTTQDAIKAMETLKPFIGLNQLTTVRVLMRGEEKQFFIDKMVELSARVNAMPETYAQDGLGDKAKVFLHYFKGGADWFITEKDMGDESDDTGQHQAFGLVNLGFGFPDSMGYISIAELIELNVELDFYYDPKTLGEVKAR